VRCSHDKGRKWDKLLDLLEPTVFFDTTSSGSDSSRIVDNMSVRFMLFGAGAGVFDDSGFSSADVLDFTERERDEVERSFLDGAEDAVKG
jgi:hypothetical protein